MSIVGHYFGLHFLPLKRRLERKWNPKWNYR